ncbi:hypothetical protein [Streptomyces kronopolitis]|uniref:hypothetical protein n=1 Tax=Streptomyces kronopolitis TaxID=1612435 RepID=UPI0036AEEB05
MDQHSAPSTFAHPAWAGWIYLGLAALAGAQLLATMLQSGAADPGFVPSVVGVIAFPALAGPALRRRHTGRPGRHG